MSCDSVKCAQCPNVVKRCTLINGLCVSCHGKKVREAAQKQNTPKQ